MKNLFFIKIILISALGWTYRLWQMQIFDYFGKTRFSDEITYYLGGAAEVSKMGLSFFLQERSLWNAPLNTLWVYILQSNISLIQCLNSLLFSISIILLSLVVKKFISERAAILFALLLSIHQPLVVLNTSILSEPLFIFFMACGYTVFSLKNRVFFAGILFSLACLTRPTLLLFPLAFILYAFCNNFFVKQSIVKYSFLFALGFSLLTVGFISKNYYVFKDPVVAYGSGAVLFLGNDLRKDGDEPVYSQMDFDTYEVSRPFTHLDKIGDQRLKEAAIKNIKAHPLAIVKLSFRKVFRLVFGYPSQYFFPKRHWPLEDLNNGLSANEYLTLATQLLTVFLVCISSFSFLFGLLIRKKAPAILVAEVIAIYFFLIHVPLFAIPRMVDVAFPYILISSLFCFNRTKISHAIALLLASVILTLGIANYGRFKNYWIVSDNYANYIDTTYEFSSSAVTYGKIRKDKKQNLYYSFARLKIPKQSVEKNTIILLKIENQGESVLACARPFLIKVSSNQPRFCFPLNKGIYTYRIVVQPEKLKSFDWLRINFKSKEAMSPSIKSIAIGK